MRTQAQAVAMKTIHFQSNQEEKSSDYMTLHWKKNISFIQYLSVFSGMYQFQSTKYNTYKKTQTTLGLLGT